LENNEISIKTTKRGFRPEGGGEVNVKVGITKYLKAVNLT
jgi:RNA 3'-terminal phosphate cyclase